MATVNDLLKALKRKCQFELPEHRAEERGKFVQEAATQIRIIGRLVSNGTTASMNNWLLIMDALMTRMEQPGVTWKVDISKWYFKRGGRIVFAWRILLQGEAIQSKITEITTVVTGSAVSSRSEVTEIALPGVGRANRNENSNGRGAGLSGKVAVGPMAIAALMGKGG
jgi:hypothetical protein